MSVWYGDQLVLVEQFGSVIVALKPSPRTLSSMPPRPVRISIGVFTFATRNQHRTLVAGHVGTVQIEQNDVVIVELAEIDSLLRRRWEAAAVRKRHGSGAPDEMQLDFAEPSVLVAAANRCHRVATQTSIHVML